MTVLHADPRWVKRSDAVKIPKIDMPFLLAVESVRCLSILETVCRKDLFSLTQNIEAIFLLSSIETGNLFRSMLLKCVVT